MSHSLNNTISHNASELFLIKTQHQFSAQLQRFNWMTASVLNFASHGILALQSVIYGIDINAGILL